jgi:hypothetical protein
MVLSAVATTRLSREIMNDASEARPRTHFCFDVSCLPPVVMPYFLSSRCERGTSFSGADYYQSVLKNNQPEPLQDFSW